MTRVHAPPERYVTLLGGAIAGSHPSRARIEDVLVAGYAIPLPSKTATLYKWQNLALTGYTTAPFPPRTKMYKWPNPLWPVIQLLRALLLYIRPRPDLATYTTPRRTLKPKRVYSGWLGRDYKRRKRAAWV